jgi:hypothetical protein
MIVCVKTRCFKNRIVLGLKFCNSSIYSLDYAVGNLYIRLTTVADTYHESIMGTSASKATARQPTVDPPVDNGPCQEKACAIQWCLAANGYQQEPCNEQVRQFQECMRGYQEELRQKKPS